MAKLLPCPFCGGECYANSAFDVIFIKCTKCGAVISFDNDKCRRMSTKAFELFNTRTPKE